MTDLVLLSIVVVATICALLAIGLFGYLIGLNNVVEFSEREVEKNPDPLFQSDKPRSWDLEPEDIDKIEDWEEFNERVED